MERPSRHTLSAAMSPRTGEVYAHTALRGVAALGVVGYHAILTTNPDITHPAGLFFRHAFLFVDLFFVLSGFIMAETYANRFRSGFNLSGATDYWRRRLTKILPNYYVWLAISLAVFAVTQQLGSATAPAPGCLQTAMIQHLLLVQNLMGSCLYLNNPLWSIVTELAAYALFPLLALLLTRSSAVILLAISAALYGTLVALYGSIDLIFGFPSVLRTLAGFMLGMALSQSVASLSAPRVSWAQLPLVAVVIIAVAGRFELLALIAMPALAVVTAQNTGLLGRVSRQAWLYWPGRASFSVYLAHAPVRYLSAPVLYKLEAETGVPLVSAWWCYVTIQCGLALVVGLAAYVWIEHWFETKLRGAKRARP